MFLSRQGKSKMEQETTIYLPKSERLIGVLGRKRDFYKAMCVKMGELATESWNKARYGLLSGYGGDCAILSTLLSKESVSPDKLARSLFNLRSAKDIEVSMRASGKSRRKLIGSCLEEISVKAEGWRRYITPVCGLDNEFIGFHDRGYEITAPFPGKNGKEIVLQVDDLGRIRNAFPENYGVGGPAPITYGGNKEGFISMRDGWFAFPEIGEINTKGVRLEELSNGNGIDIISKNGAVTQIDGILNVEKVYHESDDEFDNYLIRLSRGVNRTSQFESLVRGD